MNVGSLIVDLVTDATEYTKGLADAESQNKSWASRIGGVASTALKGAIVGGAAAAVIGIGAIGSAAFDVSQQTQQASADIAASLGLPIEEAERFGDVARQVYGSNFADSVTEAGAAVADVAKQLQLAADDPSLASITQKAFALADTFGADVPDTVSTAKTLMEQFGLSSEEAFDYIAAGYQKGLDRSGDFLDTINEYSVQFAEGGANVGQFFSALDSGLQGGMLGTDKAADLFKEFRLRIQDGSDSTRDSLNAIGIDADAMAQQFADGTLNAADAFTLVQNALRATEDQNLQFTAGVALMGSQFEDLGQSAALGTQLTNESFASIAGAADSLNVKYNTLGDAVSAIWRRLVVAVAPFTDKLLDLVNSAMPTVMAGFDAFEQNVGPALEQVSAVVSTVFGFIMGWWSELGSSVDGGTERFGYFSTWIDENMPRIQLIVETVLGAMAAFWEDHGETISRVVGNTFDTAFTIIDTTINNILDVVGIVLALLTGDWEGAWEGVQDITERTWGAIGRVTGNQLDSLTGVLSIFTGDIGESWTSFTGGLQTGWGNFTTWLGTNTETALNGAGSFFTNTATTVSSGWISFTGGLQTGWGNFTDWLGSTTQTALGSVEGHWTAHKGNVDTIVGNQWESLKTLFQTNADAVNGMLQASLQFLQGDWEGGLNTLTTTAETVWENLKRVFDLQLENIENLFAFFGWEGIGENIVRGIRDGISDSVRWIVEAAEDAARSAYEAAKSWLGIRSPSTKFEDLGEFSGEGYGRGWDRSIDGVARQIDNSLAALMGNLSPHTPASPGAGAGASGGIILQQNFYGPADPTVVRQAGQDGVLAGLRQAGLQ